MGEEDKSKGESSIETEDRSNSIIHNIGSKVSSLYKQSRDISKKGKEKIGSYARYIKKNRPIWIPYTIAGVLAATNTCSPTRISHEQDDDRNSSTNYEEATFSQNLDDSDSLWAPNNDLGQQIADLLNQGINSVVKPISNIPSHRENNNPPNGDIVYSEYDFNASGNSHSLFGYANRYHPDEDPLAVVAGIMIDNPSITNPNIIGGDLRVRGNYSSIQFPDESARNSFAAAIDGSNPSNNFRASLYEIAEANGYNSYNPEEMQEFVNRLNGQPTQRAETFVEHSTNEVFPKYEAPVSTNDGSEIISFDARAGSPNEVPRVEMGGFVQAPNYVIDVRAGSPNEVPRTYVESTNLEDIVLAETPSWPRIDEKTVTYTNIVEEAPEAFTPIIPYGSSTSQINVYDFIQMGEQETPRSGLIDYILGRIDYANGFLDRLLENIRNYESVAPTNFSERQIDFILPEIIEQTSGIQLPITQDSSVYQTQEVQDFEPYIDNEAAQGIISLDVRTGSPNEVPRVEMGGFVQTPNYVIDVRAGSPNEVPRTYTEYSHILDQDGVSVNRFVTLNESFVEVEEARQNLLDVLRTYDFNPNSINLIRHQTQSSIQIGPDTSRIYTSADSNVVFDSGADVELQEQTMPQMELLPYNFTRLNGSSVNEYMMNRMNERINERVMESLSDELYELRTQQWALEHPEEVPFYSDSITNQGISLENVMWNIENIERWIYPYEFTRIENGVRDVDISRITIPRDTLPTTTNPIYVTDADSISVPIQQERYIPVENYGPAQIEIILPNNLNPVEAERIYSQPDSAQYATADSSTLSRDILFTSQQINDNASYSEQNDADSLIASIFGNINPAEGSIINFADNTQLYNGEDSQGIPLAGSSTINTGIESIIQNSSIEGNNQQPDSLNARSIHRTVEFLPEEYGTNNISVYYTPENGLIFGVDLNKLTESEYGIVVVDRNGDAVARLESTYVLADRYNVDYDERLRSVDIFGNDIPATDLIPGEEYTVYLTKGDGILQGRERVYTTLDEETFVYSP